MTSPNGSVHLPPSGGEAGNGPFLSVGKTARAVGSDLTSQDFADLEARWIERGMALRAALRRVDSLTGGEIVGRKGGNHAGIVIPYFHLGSDQVREYRLRRDHAELEYDSAGNLRPRQRYLSPPGRSNMLYVVPGIDAVLLRNVSVPVVVTEGEFKTLALWRLANHRSPAKPRFLPLGLSGVYNWRGTVGKTVGPDGSRLDVKGVIPDLDWIEWQGRKVVIAYDADAVTKELVRIGPNSLRTCAAGVHWSVASNGTWPRARASTTTWRPLGRRQSSMRSPTSTSRVQHGGGTCCARGRP